MRNESLAAKFRRSLTDERWTLFGLLVFTAAYLACYASDSNVPAPGSPGWEAWWDQGQYLQSARAFAQGNFAATEHWFPPGYSLLAAPFVYLTGRNPFVVLNFVLFAAYFLGFLRLTRDWLPRPLALTSFALGVLWPPYLLEQYIVPWNTIPIAALIVWIIVLVNESRTDARLRIDLAIALLAGLVVAIRQIDALVIVPAGAFYLWHRLRAGNWRNVAFATLPLAVPLILIAAVLLKINGSLVAPYMVQTARIGMSLSNFFHRAVFLFLDGTIYNEPHASVRSFQPLVAALLPASVAAAMLDWRRFGVAIVTCFAAFAVYVCYNDFSPVNIVRFRLVHYIEWAFPIIIASGFTGVALLLRQHRRAMLIVLGLVTAGLMCVAVHLAPDASRRVLGPGAGDCTFELVSDNPQQLEAIDFIGAQTSGHVDVWIDGRALASMRDYEQVSRAGTRLVFKNAVTAKSVKVAVSPTPNMQCAANLVRPLRYALALDAAAVRDQVFNRIDKIRVWPPEAMTRQIGHIEIAGDATVLIAGREEEGYLFLNENAGLAAGHHAAIYDVAVTGSAEHGGSVVFDVVADEKNSISLVKIVHSHGDGKPEHVRIPFDSGRFLRPVQYRLFKPRGYALRLTRIQDEQLTDEERSRMLAAESGKARALSADVLFRQIGHVAAAPNAGEIVGEPDEEGYLVYGPYEKIPAGKYAAIFTVDVTTARTDGDSALFDVAFGPGDVLTRGAQRGATAGPVPVRLEFTANEATSDLQYRIYKPKGSRVRLIEVQISRMDAEPPKVQTGGMAG